MKLIKNEVASLKVERMITRLKKKLVRQKAKHTRLLKEKENLLKSVDKLLNAPHLARSQKRDSTLKRKSCFQPSTFTSLSYNSVKK